MHLHRRAVLAGLAAGAVAPTLPALALPVRALPSGHVYRRNDTSRWPSAVYDTLVGSRWHIHQTDLGKAFRQVGTGLTFVGAGLSYDENALMLVHRFEDRREAEDPWQTMLVGWAAVNIAVNVGSWRSVTGDAFFLWFPGDDPAERFACCNEEAPPLIATAQASEDVWLYERPGS